MGNEIMRKVDCGPDFQNRSTATVRARFPKEFSMLDACRVLSYYEELAQCHNEICWLLSIFKIWLCPGELLL